MKSLCKCHICNKEFLRENRWINRHIKLKYNKIVCSKQCHNISQIKKQTVNCKQCNKEFEKQLNQIKKTKNHFCKQSCAAIYSNTHKTKGTRVSKLEKYLSEQLVILYPNIIFHFNRKDTINSELDIFIPELKLAFELNGIFHYEPIYGTEKLSQIQNNDQRKFQACLEKGIELCIIDSSKYKYFKPITAKYFLDIIQKIIESKKIF